MRYNFIFFYQLLHYFYSRIHNCLPFCHFHLLCSRKWLYFLCFSVICELCYLCFFTLSYFWFCLLSLWYVKLFEHLSYSIGCILTYLNCSSSSQAFKPYGKIWKIINFTLLNIFAILFICCILIKRLSTDWIL